MIQLRPILFLIGLLIAVLALTMLLPALADLAAGHPDWKVFVSVALLTLFPGGALAFANRGPVSEINVRQAFLLTTVAVSGPWRPPVKTKTFAAFISDSRASMRSM